LKGQVLATATFIYLDGILALLQTFYWGSNKNGFSQAVILRVI
jgi:hypothetical protein